MDTYKYKTLSHMIFKKISLLFGTVITSISISYANTDLHFLSLSDIHLNIEQDQVMQVDPSGYNPGNDMDMNTFSEIMRLIKENIFIRKDKPDFVLYLGDMVGHESLEGINRVKFVTENETRVFKTLLKTFPNTPIINVFGNNDSPEKNYGDYVYSDTSPYTIAMDSGFKNGFLSTGLICNEELKSQKTTVPCLIDKNPNLGCFSIKLQNKLIFIGLNSVMFSPNHNAETDKINAQIKFLTKELKRAKNNNISVLLGMHIPVGKNVYDGSSFWSLQYKKEFLKLVSKYADQIKGILVGHTHMEEFKIIKTANKNIGEYFTAGLSTSHGNSPSVKLFNITNSNDDWAINNYTTYQIHKSQGRLSFSKYYDFANEYCQKFNFNDDINNCLENINFEDILPKYTVNNPNYMTYKAKDPNAFYVNATGK